VSSVLIVDDMLSMRSLVKVYLMEYGFTFYEAADGAEGLRIAREKKPDVAIVDLVMPVLDGMGFLVGLRSDPTISKTPVIVLSGSEEQTARIAAYPGRRTTVTKKPIEPAKLKEAVRDALALAR
jgi:two-component system chemotaxis response regulator CheY